MRPRGFEPLASSSASLRPACLCLCPREESNLYFKIRNLVSYPLNDKGTGNGGQVYPAELWARVICSNQATKIKVNLSVVTLRVILRGGERRGKIIISSVLIVRLRRIHFLYPNPLEYILLINF